MNFYTLLVISPSGKSRSTEAAVLTSYLQSMAAHGSTLCWVYQGRKSQVPVYFPQMSDQPPPHWGRRRQTLEFSNKDPKAPCILLMRIAHLSTVLTRLGVRLYGYLIIEIWNNQPSVLETFKITELQLKYYLFISTEAWLIDLKVFANSHPG